MVARLLSAAGALAWASIVGPSIVPIAWVAVAIILVTSALVWRDDIRRGRAAMVSEAPTYAIVLDLVAAATFMVSSAPNERSVAFLLVVALGALAMFRLGATGIVLAAAVYSLARLAQEYIRLSLGIPTPPSQIAAEVIVVSLVLAIMSVTVGHYRAEQQRGARALRLARSLERIATELAEVTDPDPLFRSIASSALLLVDADHATIDQRRGAEFWIIAGAGMGERAVGVHASSERGIVGAVLRSRGTVAWDDYGADPTGLETIRELGIRSIAGVPIKVQGEIVALLAVGRLTVRRFDAEDLRALEGLAGHAAVALRNARLLELSRRLESLSREVATETRSLEEVMRRVATEIDVAYDAGVVEVTRVKGDQARTLAQVGLEGDGTSRFAPPGPLARQVITRRESVVLRDYSAEAMGDPHPAVLAAQKVGLHAVMAAPVIVGGDVVGTVMVGTTDPYRSFDAIDRQGLSGFAQVTGAALRAAQLREERDRRIHRLSALNVLAWQLAAVHEPYEIARLAYDAAGKLVPRDAFYVARFDPEKREFDFVLQSDGDDVWRGERYPLGTGPTSQVVLTGETHLVRGDGSPGSAAHVPLKSRGRLEGVLSSQSYTADAFDDEDLIVLQSLGNLVATAFENAEHMQQMRELYLASVKALAAAVDARDPYTRSHSARVAALARSVAEEMRLGPDELRRVQLGALLHDIGKIGIPDAILNKPGPLSDDEWVLMRTHPAVGASILAAVEPLRDLVPIVRTHHERYDGDGYPEKLKGDEIPLEAHIVAAADAFEVIVSRRAYKQAQTVEYACTELQRCRGTQFHPDVVDAFLRVIERDQQQGAGYLRRVAAIEQEETADMPGPGGVLEQFAANAHAHGRQLAILQRLASEISAVLDIDELAGRLLRIVCEAMGYENGFLLTIDDKREGLVVRAAVGPSEPYTGQLLPPGTGISWWVVEHGLPQHVQDAQKDPRYYGPPDINTVLVVPLQLGDERVGVLGIESPRIQAFSRDDEELLTAVSHQVAAALRVAKLHQAAKHAAATDPLTSLPNRRTFFEQLQSELTKDPNAPLSVAVLDVNGLKQRNDEHGHAAGDDALVRISELLSAGVRDGDLVARIGGDEFAVLFPNTPLLIAERAMRRLAEAIADETVPDGKRLPTIAWGVADAATRTLTVDELVDAADRAMYRQKQKTRARASTA
ncbi:MAG TPA: GAF domain-containing protein [Candidatus Limnocylindria bacterium]|nr:GAF domain-containing protein [Candidatus Limnocylindria bacterium]